MDWGKVMNAEKNSITITSNGDDVGNIQCVKNNLCFRGYKRFTDFRSEELGDL